MKVSMIPDNSVKMIHASQDDVGRRWEFELYDEDGLIDVSSVGEQMVYPVYQGGTEQILPENTSTPTTSPIIADIVYPDETRTDQEFLYRECPSVEDGNARIKKIIGNTVKFNQLVRNGNFADTSAWVTNAGHTFTVSNNIASYLPSGAGSLRQQFALTRGHKYLCRVDIKTATARTDAGLLTTINGGVFTPAVASTDWQIIQVIQTAAADSTYFAIQENGQGGETILIRNANAFDLTNIFGQGNEPQTVAEFKALYPLLFYAYNQGTLLPFLGEQIKTTGKNLYPKTAISSQTVNGVVLTVNDDGSIKAVGTATSAVSVALGDIHLRKGSYKITCEGSDDLKAYSTLRNATNNSWIANVVGEVDFIATEDIDVRLALNVISGRTANNTIYPMIRLADVQDSTYESYKESIVNLPTLDYFPTGMKDVPDYVNGGKIYDELAENLASQKIGMIDLGTKAWTWQNQWNAWYTQLEMKNPTDGVIPANIISANYNTIDIYNFVQLPSTYSNSIAKAAGTSLTLAVRNGSNSVTPSGVLYYELAEPVETPIASASLVSQNQEIPMSVEDDKLVAYSTQGITENSGFHDAKIKLSEDGVAYSAKFTMHIERKP